MAWEPPQQAGSGNHEVYEIPDDGVDGDDLTILLDVPQDLLRSTLAVLVSGRGVSLHSTWSVWFRSASREAILQPDSAWCVCSHLSILDVETSISELVDTALAQIASWQSVLHAGLLHVLSWIHGVDCHAVVFQSFQ